MSYSAKNRFEQYKAKHGNNKPNGRFITIELPEPIAAGFFAMTTIDPNKPRASMANLAEEIYHKYFAEKRQKEDFVVFCKCLFSMLIENCYKEKA